ncbi:hypothetical protein CB1_000091004 [Camelus ferus]|nr:hypothetical protein CB1_000091004 [Camelus ferus]
MHVKYLTLITESRLSSPALGQKVRNMALDDVVILNVDTNTLETPFDDLQSLPNDVVGYEVIPGLDHSSFCGAGDLASPIAVAMSREQDSLPGYPHRRQKISSLKNRLKKVSTTTGDGVARAFLKAQAAFFGSYRNALKIEPHLGLAKAASASGNVMVT